MSRKLFVGNLSYQCTAEEVRSAFSQFGEVASVNIVTDRNTGRSRGFGFVEMGDEEVEKAIKGMNGSELGGRVLTVNEAKPYVKRNYDFGLNQHHSHYEKRESGNSRYGIPKRDMFGDSPNRW